ncbi:MAG: hypothetical protein U0939_24440 [Pirellulales bacterium]
MTPDQGPVDLTTSFRIDVAPGGAAPPVPDPGQVVFQRTVVELLQRLATAQDKQNQLLEELGKQLQSAQRQRLQELNQWKAANPHLASACRAAADTLGKVQTQFLFQLTEEVRDSGESLSDSDFMLHEFVDRFGPRLAHLNGVLQVLSQLSGPVVGEAGGMD